MLSFTAVHTVSQCLLTANAEAEITGWGTPPTLLLIHHLRAELTVPTLHEMSVVEFPLHPDDLLTDPAGLPALLQRLAHALHHTDEAASMPYQATLDTIIRLIRGTRPAARLLAWAAIYDDIHTLHGRLRPARRVDAVDLDGRAYHLTDLRGEEPPLLAADDTPNPDDMPATLPGLAALLAATARFAHVHAGEATS
ncbi:hypothetical protein DLE60_09885 [Micromonospora globispora]|uniref:hypothetical protein n=1 Tax=Micromonospora globispora TaxID=1450148 RepID=UPI000D6F612A|nr:hypothetical protein [Micromonospora globispora]PWU60656.1 hypothetical protein DLE60_09885 [Micromonospora globispora]RQW94176.1 hypothetical protein DKL51_16395 [Micromonospora globispora]